MVKSRLQILNIQSQGLRCIDCDLDFRHNKNINDTKTLNLIIMPNGGGKTTIRDLITMCLSNEYQRLTTDQVYGFRKKSWEDEDQPKYEFGNFKMAIQFDDIRYDYELHFDFLSNEIKARTKESKKGKTYDEIIVPPALNKFFQENFIKIWNFNGELVDTFFQQSESLADEFISFLMRFNLIDDVISTSNTYIDQKISKLSRKNIGKSSNIQKSISKAENRLNSLNKKRQSLTLELDEQKEKKRNNDEILKNLKNIINPELQKKIEDLETEQEKLEIHRDEITLSFFQSLKNPFSVSDFFGEKLSEFKDNLDKEKLPETTSKAFFEDLKSSDECVCGEKMDDKKRSKIDENKQKYLDTDDWQILNSIKTSIENDSKNIQPIDFKKFEAQIRKINNEISDKRNLKLEYEEQIQDSSNNEKENFDKALKDRDALGDKISKLEAQIQLIDNPKIKDREQSDPESMWSIENVTDFIHKKKRDLFAANNKEDISGKLDIIENILKSVRLTIKDIVGKQLISEINQNIREILSTQVSVEKITNFIKLKGAEDASVGQKLAIVYSFINSLLSRAQFRSLLIIDSPFGALGIDEKKEISQKIPNSKEQQMIFFITTSEREGVIKNWEKKYDKDINYFVLQSNRDDIEEAILNKINSKLKTNDRLIKHKDGFQIEGRDYFSQAE